MDSNNQLIPATGHHQMIHELEQELLELELTCFHENLPSHVKNVYYNQFLLKRANLFWNLGDYEKCSLDLVAVRSNGLPMMAFPYPFQWLMVINK